MEALLMINFNANIDQFKDSLLNINRVKAAEIFKNSTIENNSIQTIESIIFQSLDQIGDGWEKGTISLSQVYMSGIICEELIDAYFHESKITRKNSPKIAIAVLHDHHSLGKRIVYSALRAGGYDLIDFGQGLSSEELVEKAIHNKIEVLLISTLMLHSALKVKDVRAEFNLKNVPIMIIVGGAPFRLDKQLWVEVGADAEGNNASDALRLIEGVVLK